MSRRTRRAGTPAEIALPSGFDGPHVLRLALTLSIASGCPCRLREVRAADTPAGLRRLELATLAAASAVCGGRLGGATLGSTDVTFEPGAPVPGTHRVALGNGGAVAPVMAMLAPALLRIDAPSTLRLSGSTDAPGGPTVDALAAMWTPLLERIGGRVDVTVHRHGFTPVGGGAVDVRVTPAPPVPLALAPDGAAPALTAECTLGGGLSRSIAVRELETLASLLDLDLADCHVGEHDSERPGNVLRLVARYRSHVETFEEHGREGVPAAIVATRLAKRWQRRRRAEPERVSSDLLTTLLPLLVTGGGGEVMCHAPRAGLERLLDVARAFGPFGAEWRPLDAAAAEGVGRLHVR